MTFFYCGGFHGYTISITDINKLILNITKPIHVLHAHRTDTIYNVDINYFGPTKLPYYFSVTLAATDDNSK